MRTTSFRILVVACVGLSIAVDQTVRADESKSGAPRSLARDNAAALHSPILLAAAQPATKNTPPPVGASEETSSQTSGTPTYMRDVLPILMGKCSRCHNSQAKFVFNWLDYGTAYHDRWEIRRRIWDSWKGTYYKEAMPIQNSPEQQTITDAERRKIRDWVMAGAPRGTAPIFSGTRTTTQRIELGGKLFASICAACHQPSGLGIPTVFPPLAGSDFLNADKNRAIKTVINGRQGEIIVNGRKFNNTMPAFPLTDDDIANVLTFVYNSFGNVGHEVTMAEVAKLRAEPPEPSLGPRKPSAYE